MTTINSDAHAIEAPPIAVASGIRRTGGAVTAFAAATARPIRWLAARAAGLVSATHLGRDAETEMGRWTGTRS